jgi:hypothetical protein
MKIYIDNFFYDLNLSPFKKLFDSIFNVNTVLGTIEDSDILLESVFGDETLLYHKKWKYTFLFIGESDRRFWLTMPKRTLTNTLKDYSCILKGEKDNNNIVNFPLFILYNYCFDFAHKFIKYNYVVSDNNDILNNRITFIPPKDVCVIISNGNDSEGRNYFCDKLEERVRIDYAGNYKNNVPRIEHSHCSPEFINFVSQYKVIISMENSKNKTYITEKILYGFAANTVPVYWGSDHIGEYFNEERFINVNSFDELEINKAIDKICLLLSDNEKYLEMVNKPIYPNNRIPLTMHNISNNIKKLLNIEHKSKTKFITFGGPSYYYNSVNRICEEARNIDVFDEITGFTDIDLKCDVSFWENHGNFIENNRRGYGYWLWKSYLIKQELDKLKENDFLIYCDAGCQINKNGKARLLEYIDLLNMNKDEFGLISFQLGYKELLYTKQQIFEHFLCDENSKKMIQSMAGVLIIRKNSHSVNIVDKWYEGCSNYHLINDELSCEDSLFVENRHDQSILSILVNKYGSIKLADETYFSPNWDTDGKEYPFWATRTV